MVPDGPPPERIAAPAGSSATRSFDIVSGSALHAALTVAARKDAEGKTIAVLLPDTGERYVTTALFA